MFPIGSLFAFLQRLQLASGIVASGGRGVVHGVGQIVRAARSHPCGFGPAPLAGTYGASAAGRCRDCQTGRRYSLCCFEAGHTRDAISSNLGGRPRPGLCNQLHRLPGCLDHETLLGDHETLLDALDFLSSAMQPRPATGRPRSSNLAAFRYWL